MRIHLIATAWLSLAACYSPELRDCTVTCSAPDECADDQVCTSGLCRAPDATCNDSASRVAVRLEVIGEGKVVIAGVGTCSSDDETHVCNWTVTIGTQLELEAMELDDRPFDRWTTSNCAGQDESCSLTARSITVVGAKFR